MHRIVSTTSLMSILPQNIYLGGIELIFSENKHCCRIKGIGNAAVIVDMMGVMNILTQIPDT